MTQPIKYFVFYYSIILINTYAAQNAVITLKLA